MTIRSNFRRIPMGVFRECIISLLGTKFTSCAPVLKGGTTNMHQFSITVLTLSVVEVLSLQITTITFNTAYCIPNRSSTTPLLGVNDTRSSATEYLTTTENSGTPARLSSRHGLAYSIFHNPYNRREDPATFELDFIRNLPALSDPEKANFSWLTCGITQWPNISTQLYIDGSSSPYGTLPGHRNTVDMSAAAILMQGYFIMPASGTYAVSGVFDNFGFFWLGRKAYNPWSASATATGTTASDANSDGRIIPGTSGVANLYFRSGEIVPFTGLWANAGGPGLFQLNALLPNGSMWKDNWVDHLLLPNPNDPWVPRPRIDSQKDPATCPELPAATGGVLCGLDNVQPVYHGSNNVLDKMFDKQIIATEIF